MLTIRMHEDLSSSPPQGHCSACVELQFGPSCSPTVPRRFKSSQGSSVTARREFWNMLLELLENDLGKTDKELMMLEVASLRKENTLTGFLWPLIPMMKRFCDEKIGIPSCSSSVHPQNTPTTSSSIQLKPCHNWTLFFFREYSSLSLTPGHLGQRNDLLVA